jgi:hypothetical protein
MSTVKRTKDDIDVLEHTMQGVHTSANQGKIISFHRERGIVGISTETEIRSLADTPAEHVVIVKMARASQRRRRSR